MADQILFKFKEYVQLWQSNRTACIETINGPMIQYNTKIYKGATNTIDFVVRNNDRKPINLAGYQIDALIQRVEQPELLLEKSVQATNELTGRARLTLLPSDIDDWLSSFYRYTIRLTDVTGRQEYLYTDINRSTSGTFELVDSMSMALSPAKEIKASAFSPFPTGEYDNAWITGSLPGDAQDNKANGMHTIVAYTKNKFLGEFWIQGSLTINPPLQTDWFNIPLTTESPQFNYTETDSPSIRVFNLSGNYYWIRMFYKISPVNRGEFLKVMYKN